MAEPLLSTSIWSGWFTPTYLFLFMNLVIGTIAIISRFNSHKPATHHEEMRPLARVPSLIDRVKSINLSFYKFQPHETTTDYVYHYTDPPLPAEYYPDPPQLERAPSLLERVKSIKFPSLYRSEHAEIQVPDEPGDSGHELGPGVELEHEHHVTRSKSESRVSERKSKKKEKMKKSESERGMDEPHDREEGEEEERESIEKRRPATTRLEKTVSFLGEDNGVDAKADDFINKFKQQLKLQRLDSLLRYRDMLQGKSKNN